MKRAVVLCGIAVALGALLVNAAQEPTVDEMIQQFSRDLTKLVARLKDVRDDAGANAAADRLAALDKPIGDALQRLPRMATPPGPAGLQTLAEITKQVEEIDQQFTRVGAIPKGKAALDRLPETRAFVSKIRDAPFARARADVQTFTKAALAYKIKFATFPDKLETLQSPPNGFPYIEPNKEVLLDPWGRPYKYDPAGPRNQGLKPDVWSEGPDPNDKTKVIGNWPQGK